LSTPSAGSFTAWAKAVADPAGLVPPELAVLIERDAEVGSEGSIPVVHAVPVDQARRRRAGLSSTAVDIEAVRQGDRGSALEHLVDRLSRGWIEAPWGGDPMTAQPWDVLTPRPWTPVGPRREILKRLAAQAKVSADAMKREILKSAVIAAIHDDDRPAGHTLLWAIYGGKGPKDADQIIGRRRPGEVEEWDVYVQWFHRRVLALADGFLDEESETESVSTPVEDASPELKAPSASLDARFSGEVRGSKSQPAPDLAPLGGAAEPSIDGRRIMRSLVAVFVAEGSGEMRPVLTSEAPRVVAVVRGAIAAEVDGLAPEGQAGNTSWAERLWTCPPETRVGVRELAEAIGRPRSWVYRHASPRGDLAPIPHRRLDGLLVFTAGEVRDWLRANEEHR
jgi:hypothetical protein